MPEGNKTEKPTAKRRGDARKKGNIFTSKDTVILVSMFMSFYMIKATFPGIYDKLHEFMTRYIGYTLTQTEVTESLVFKVVRETITEAVAIAMPIMFVTTLATVCVTLWQTRLLFTWEPLRPKFGKLNPINGIKNLLSLRSLVEVFKNTLKVAILFILLYNFFVGRLAEFPRLLDMDIIHSSTYLLSICFSLMLQLCMAFIAIGILDYFYQKWEYERNLKMSKEEIKEEYKQMEGDPKIKGKIKAKQRELAMQRMMQAVPLADVVIKNPTHFAVALRYDIDKDRAPVVIAKGQDEVALRIIRVAEQHDIYVLENKPLARAIYAATDIDSEIPLEYYGVIAEILVTVYKIKNKNVT